jgi:UDP-N-acetylmuramoyl-tripeptide--D-alanyl-D-alanine ligase
MSYKPSGVKKHYHDNRRAFARFWMSLMNPVQVAITGSQGKTNTTKVVTAILASLGSTVVTDTNLDTSFNVPITALKVRPWTKYVVWELGIDHPGEMENHLTIAHPDIGIITGISPVHTDGEHMGSLATLIAEKQKLIEHLTKDGIAILNADNEHVRSMASHTRAKVLWYGSREKYDIWVEPNAVELSLEGTKGFFHTKDESFVVQSPLIGVHHLHNLMAAYLVMKSVTGEQKLGEKFAHIVATVKPLKGRMSVDKGPFDTVLLNDSLRANPESTRSGLETLALLNYTKGRKIAVIGEMGELEKPEDEHRKTGETIAKYAFDSVICIGPLRKHTIDEAIKKGFPANNIMYAAGVREAADILKKILKPGDLWYLKGSLLRNYKRIVQLLNGEKICCEEVLCPYEHCGYSETG